MSTIAQEIAKLNYVALKNVAAFDVGCMPEDRSDPKKLARILDVNSHDVHVEAGGYFVDGVGVALKLRERMSWKVVYASEADIKACSFVSPDTYVHEKMEKQADGTVKKSGAVIGFTNPLQVLHEATEEYYLATKHLGGGIANASRIRKLEAEVAETQKVKEELAKEKATRIAVMTEREQLLAQIAELKAKQAFQKPGR